MCRGVFAPLARHSPLSAHCSRARPRNKSRGQTPGRSPLFVEIFAYPRQQRTIIMTTLYYTIKPCAGMRRRTFLSRALYPANRHVGPRSKIPRFAASTRNPAARAFFRKSPYSVQLTRHPNLCNLHVHEDGLSGDLGRLRDVWIRVVHSYYYAVQATSARAFGHREILYIHTHTYTYTSQPNVSTF